MQLGSLALFLASTTIVCRTLTVVKNEKKVNMYIKVNVTNQESTTVVLLETIINLFKLSKDVQICTDVIYGPMNVSRKFIGAQPDAVNLANKLVFEDLKSCQFKPILPQIFVAMTILQNVNKSNAAKVLHDATEQLKKGVKMAASTDDRPGENVLVRILFFKDGITYNYIIGGLIKPELAKSGNNFDQKDNLQMAVNKLLGLIDTDIRYRLSMCDIGYETVQCRYDMEGQCGMETLVTPVPVSPTTGNLSQQLPYCIREHSTWNYTVCPRGYCEQACQNESNIRWSECNDTCQPSFQMLEYIDETGFTRCPDFLRPPIRRCDWAPECRQVGMALMITGGTIGIVAVLGFIVYFKYTGMCSKEDVTATASGKFSDQPSMGKAADVDQAKTMIEATKMSVKIDAQSAARSGDQVSVKSIPTARSAGATSIKGASVKPESPKVQSIKGQSVKGQSIKGESVKAQTAKADPAKGESVKGQSVKGQSVKAETAKAGSVKT